MAITHDPIAVLGQGITAQYVKDFAKKHHIQVVEPAQASVVIASPGIPKSQFPAVTAPIISEIEWAYQLFQQSDQPPQLIAVTGTNGKSTVTAMISQVCDIPYAGNIGIPLISFVGLEAEFPQIVVELSSYQLETCVSFKPDIAVFLNFSADHLTRHQTLNDYLDQKKKCFQHQTTSDFLVYFSEDQWVTTVAKQSNATCVEFNSTMITKHMLDQHHLPGEHNKLNMLATQKVAELLNIESNIINFNFTNFTPLRHRLEKLKSVDNLTVINDSKATNPESTIAAINSFDQPIWLICCGENKQLELTELAQTICEKTKGVIVFGDIALSLIEAIFKVDAAFNVTSVKTMDLAIELALKEATNEDVILFSPSSSSQDQFKSFEQRGNRFAQKVEEHVKSLMV